MKLKISKVIASLLGTSVQGKVTNNICRFSNMTNIEVAVQSTGLAHVVLNQPPVNSLSEEFLTNISSTFKKIECDKSIRGIILSSKFHGKVFSAGLHIPELCNRSDAQLRSYWRCVQEWYLDLYGLSKPVVAAVNGHAPAGGCAMVLMTDYRIMMNGKVIGLNETRLGLVTPLVFVDMLSSVFGRRSSEHTLSLGTLFSSEEALNIGLVDEVCDVDDVMSAAQLQVDQLMSVPQPAFAMNKRLFRNKFLQRLRDTREQDIENFVNMTQQAQVQKIIMKYMQKLKNE